MSPVTGKRFKIGRGGGEVCELGSKVMPASGVVLAVLIGHALKHVSRGDVDERVCFECGVVGKEMLLFFFAVHERG